MAHGGTTTVLAGAGLLQLVQLQDLDADLAFPGLLRLFGLLLLSTPDALEGLAHVGVEARLVAERGIENMFHAALQTLGAATGRLFQPAAVGVGDRFSLRGLDLGETVIFFK